MSDRRAAFDSLAQHPWFGRLVKRLKRADVELCLQFITNNAELSPAAFEMALNRVFIHDPAKPKNWKIICELLCVANTTDMAHRAAK